jgi:cytochrome P450
MVLEDTASFEFGDQEFARDPFDLWKQFRETPGLIRSEQHGGFYILSRFEDVRRAATQEKTFCARHGRQVPRHAGALLPSDADGAIHRRYRRVLNAWMSEEAMASLEPVFYRVANQLLDAIVDKRELDLSQEYILPAIQQTAMEWLDLPMEDGPALACWAHDLLAEKILVGPEAGPKAWEALCAYVTDYMEKRRRAPRREDIVQAILDTEIEGRPINDNEAMLLILSIYLGAVLTTGSSLGFSFHHLAHNPDARDLLRDADRGQMELAVEEFLRTAATLVYQARTVDEDTEMAGCPLHKGDRVAMMYSSANRDPREFPNPDEVILDRTPNRHMAFGHGPHKCVGAPFARMGMRVVIQEALKRLGDFEIADESGVRVETSTNRLVMNLPIVQQRR